MAERADAALTVGAIGDGSPHNLTSRFTLASMPSLAQPVRETVTEAM
jgi:hypothetical protein